MAHLDEYKLLTDRQHAFRKGYSCETQLTTVINEWAKILDNRGQVVTFILDFEKAFDTSPHELLKSKLFSYGTGGKTLKWIDSFLCFRQQRVVVNAVKSGWEMGYEISTCQMQYKAADKKTDQEDPCFIYLREN